MYIMSRRDLLSFIRKIAWYEQYFVTRICNKATDSKYRRYNNVHVDYKINII